MNNEMRQIQMYNLIKEKGEVTVASLAEQFSVSPITIRRALSKLKEAGLVNHAYGKVGIIDNSQKELTFDERVKMNQQSKVRIAWSALRYINDRGIKSIYLDGSSSVLEIAKAMNENQPLTVFTNSFYILQELKKKPRIRTFFIGGFMDWSDCSCTDITTEDMCKQFFVEATFTSCGGFSENGMFNNGYTGAQIRRIMMKNSMCNYLLADHTKFNIQGIFLLNAWDMIDVLITDEEIPESFQNSIKSSKVEICVAP